MSDLFGLEEETRHKDAVLSPCGVYRYRLLRAWDDKPRVWWVMLNPSTADASVDDPTIRRVVSFSQGWGYGGCVVVNLFALRATDPAALKGHADPIGPDNDLHLRLALAAPLVVAAWGANKTCGRDQAVMRLLAGKSLHCLEKTKEGHPKHPLYVRGDATPTLFREAL